MSFILKPSRTFVLPETGSPCAAPKRLTPFREVEAAVAAIAEGPERWPPYIHDTRRYLLRRFPFSVVYREIASSIQIVAIAHSKRRPGFWQAR